MQPVTAYVALGSNLGDRAANIAAAVAALLQTLGVEVTKISNLLDNPAVGGPTDSPPFLNAAVEIRTTLSPRDLLNALLKIELAQGRQRCEKWGPRIIDLDIVLYGDETIDEPDLHIPHPLMHERRFVLEPLAEIAPHTIHPRLRKSMRELLAATRAK